MSSPTTPARVIIASDACQSGQHAECNGIAISGNGMECQCACHSSPTTPAGATKGPIYSVPLLDTLIINDGPMRQQLPNRADLEQVAEINQRAVAGYEVLLCHYHNQQRLLDQLAKQLENCLDDLRDLHGMERPDAPPFNFSDRIDDGDELLQQVKRLAGRGS